MAIYHTPYLNDLKFPSNIKNYKIGKSQETLNDIRNFYININNNQILLELKNALKVEKEITALSRNFASIIVPLIYAISIIPLYGKLYELIYNFIYEVCYDFIIIDLGINCTVNQVGFLALSIIGTALIIIIIPLFRLATKSTQRLLPKELFLNDCIELIDKIIYENTIILPLSEDQKMFCDAYVNRYDLNGVEAAKSIGWCDATSYEVAVMYLLNPKCKLYIDQELDKRRTR